MNFDCLVKGCEILINPLFHCTKFGGELKFKVRYGFPLGYPFWKNTKAENKKERKIKEKKKERKCWPCWNCKFL